MTTIESLKEDFKQKLFELTGEEFTIRLYQRSASSEKRDKVLALIAEFYNVSVGELVFKTSKMDYINRKYISYKIIQDNVPFITLANIGVPFDLKHDAVIHGLKKFNDFCESEPKYLKEYENVNKYVLDNLK